jgi:crossover junction endodeoxyribonuclease RuvC
VTLTIGIDPGLSGAVAILNDHHLVDVYDLPVIGKHINAAELATYEGWRTNPGGFHAVIEAVHAMPRQGVSSVFTFGRSLGAVEGVFAALGVPVSWVTPARWKKDMHLSADKNESRRMATELWPHKASSFHRVKDDGRAEAALIALWWQRHGKGETK